MICRKCQRPIGSKTNFCRKCGQRREATETLSDLLEPFGFKCRIDKVREDGKEVVVSHKLPGTNLHGLMIFVPDEKDDEDIAVKSLARDVITVIVNKVWDDLDTKAA